MYLLIFIFSLAGLIFIVLRKISILVAIPNNHIEIDSFSFKKLFLKFFNIPKEAMKPLFLKIAEKTLHKTKILSLKIHNISHSAVEKVKGKIKKEDDEN